MSAAVSTAAADVAAARFGAALEHLEQAATAASNAQDGLRSDSPVPYVARVWLRAARRRLDRAEAAIRLGEAALRRRETGEQ